MSAAPVLSQVAVIREEECIGCTKCIQACPVDAIIGASKKMHTIMANLCIGCELCVKPCPVDCIDLIPRKIHPPVQQHALVSQSQFRMIQHEERLMRQAQKKPTDQLHQDFQQQTPSAQQAAIQAAVLRAQAKKAIR